MNKNNNSGNNLLFVTKSGFKIVFKLDRWYYINNNEILWLKKTSSVIFTIGVDILSLFKSGMVNKISLRTIGSTVDAESPLVRIETDKPGCCGGLLLKTYFTPWKLEIVEVNEELRNNYSLIQNYPFSKGWIYKAKVFESHSSNKNYKLDIGTIIPPFNEEYLYKEVRQILVRNNLVSIGKY